MKCAICGRDFPEEELFEGVLCYGCKARQDKLDQEEEFKAYEADMLAYNHKGEWCWLTGKTLCQEGYCSECVIYQDWKDSLRKVSAE